MRLVAMRRGKARRGKTGQGEARRDPSQGIPLSRLRYHNSRASRSIWFTGLGRSVSLSVVRFGLGRNHIIFSLWVAQCDGDGDSTNGHSRRCGVKHINDNDDDDEDEDGDADVDGDDDDHNDDHADGDDDDDGLDDDDNEMQTPQDWRCGAYRNRERDTERKGQREKKEPKRSSAGWQDGTWVSVSVSVSVSSLIVGELRTFVLLRVCISWNGQRAPTTSTQPQKCGAKGSVQNGTWSRSRCQTVCECVSYLYISVHVCVSVI